MSATLYLDNNRSLVLPDPMVSRLEDEALIYRCQAHDRGQDQGFHLWKATERTLTELFPVPESDTPEGE